MSEPLKNGLYDIMLQQKLQQGFDSPRLHSSLERMRKRRMPFEASAKKGG